ncbi:hypothetical protein MCOR27_009465 [Pyricularia oryzae]|uniref:FAD dependent oxidoreductase domain-containing protein n=2 Tax=Pyricularia TaxID=48558 RepID=A0ABQ8NEP7_PYRGI|nr:hypothetical protein MCOR01_009807 [Pyricularia oryzae]KAI6295319.1 hypothetical protein MCOR33_007767 [Pyricularia grisea]KAI6260765.1 hypothetical protein MCOR19_002981 [Pyricularia oryzae]KAI6270075.1 hypothetical protein MCOR27_009465 [Pyricularia oryzae]KAI6276686.1 hypothetical protein MCOR26_005478 [Pyricularia oryzae]
MSTVIVGSGIIGVATAFYLSKSEAPSSIHLVDNSDVLFSSASGFAGGFLAKDWFNGAMLRLAQLSFQEHQRLAREQGGPEKWGYRTGTAFSYIPAPETADAAKTISGDWLRQGTSRSEEAANSEEPAQVEEQAPAWLRRYKGDSIDCLSVDTVAQVDPAALCRFLLSQCIDAGVHLHQPATVLSVHADNRGELASVRIADTKSSLETDIPCTRVVVTAGAWSPQVFKTLFPDSPVERLPIFSLAGYSLLLKTPHWKANTVDTGFQRSHAVYSARMGGMAPEMFSWGDGTVYIAGLNDAAMPLPKVATEAKKQIQPESMERLKDTARKLVEGELEFTREALCFRPVTDIGTPIISRVPDEMLGNGVTTRGGSQGGVFLVAGHGPWGINLSLGTGKVAAEMVMGRGSSIGDMDFFALSRFV